MTTLTRDGLCAVIVTYHPDEEIAARVARIAAQVDRVVIVDNHSRPDTLASLHALATQAGVEVIFNAENRGIAAALNQGVRRAFEQGYSFALLFDQDTVALEMTSVYARIYSEVSAGGREALVGANFLRSVDGQVGKKIRPGAVPAGSSGLWARAVTVLTSGTLLPKTVWETLGEFRDEFFIDGVDDEYCLRARAAGVQVVRSAEPLMQHSIGEQSSYRLLGRTGWMHNYSPLRHYCRSRNALVLWRTYLWREPRWVAFHILFNVRIAGKVCLFEPQKGQKLRSIGLGIWDGLRGRFDLLSRRIAKLS